MAAIARRHGLSGELVRGELGSHLVFRCQDTWIKLFFPLWKEQARMELAGLRTVGGRLRREVPTLRGEGELEGWPYLLVRHVPGERIGDVWKRSAAARKAELARELARVTRELQALSPDPAVRERLDWNPWIEDRFRACLAHHEAKGMAPAELRKLERLLAGFSAAEFHASRPVFLHADLTHDHFLVEGARVAGVIDFADCRVGHGEYDLVAFFTYVLAGEREARAAFWEEWGAPVEPARLFAWCALHEFSDLAQAWGAERLAGAGDFRALAQELFG